MEQLKWQKEIELYRSFKTTFILEGNIFDLQPYIMGNKDEQQIILMSLDNYLYRYLHDVGYKTVVFFNHVDGFYNQFNKDEIKAFKKILKQNAQENEDFKLTSNDRNSKFGQATEHLRNALSNLKEPVAIIMNFASRYITQPSVLDADEQYFYSELLIASQNKVEPAVLGQENQQLGNLMFMVADKLNDLPAWFYLNNSYVRTIQIDIPNPDLRSDFFDTNYDTFFGYEAILSDDIPTVKNKFIDLTDGFKNVELNDLRELMVKEAIGLSKIEDAVTLFKHGIKNNPWNDPRLIEKLNSIDKDLKKRVKGQDVCVQQAVDVVSRAIYGLSGLQHSSSKSKPKGIMFLAGPTGTGKTELAKSLAEWLFGSEDFCIRFDMSEFQQSHSDQRLLGAPPGYVGYEAGGQLTNAVKNKPFSILLFDEIEKAHPSILDKFLQILEDGRMTDGKGETIYFSDTLIIFTSNLGIYTKDFTTGRNVATVKYGDDQLDYDTYRQNILNGIREYFTTGIGRPEIMNRIGENFVIFKYISKEAALLIGNAQIKKITQNLLNQKNIELIISTKAYDELYSFINEKLDGGGRGIGNTIEKCLINPLSRFISENMITYPCQLIIESVYKNGDIIELICKIEK